MPTTRSHAASTPASRSFSRRATRSAGTVSPGTVIAVPEWGEGGHPAFGLADLVVDSLLNVSDATLDARLVFAVSESGCRDG